MANFEEIALRSLLYAIFALSANGAVSNIMDRCCNIGRQWYTLSSGTCGPHIAVIEGLEPGDRAACSAVEEVCCLLHRQDRQCTLGKQQAKLRRGCDALHGGPGSEDARECCNCCSLGIIAQEQGLACSLFQRYGVHCDAAFQECCDLGRRGRFDPDAHQPFRPSTSSLSPTATSTVAVDRCAVNNPCQQRCIDVLFTAVCGCFEGYTLDADQRTCNDLDECALNRRLCASHQRCVNTPGSFKCDDVTHQDRCLPGYSWNRYAGQCDDVDECAGSTTVCHPSMFCTNTPGSFRCVPIGGGEDGEISDADPYPDLLPPLLPPRPPPTTTTTTTTTQNPLSVNCGTGFSFSSHTGQCEDINECALNRDTCTEGQTCENSIGSYHCRRSLGCGTGYTLDQDTQQCLDDDECRMETHNCGPARDCRNLPGTFRCVMKTCPHGYKLDVHTGVCNPVECPRGMRPDDDGNCIDINECIERPEVCRANQECRNEIGSYTCFSRLTCGAGYELNDAGSRCNDIDECRTGNHDCTGSLMECVNRPGTYMCQCPQGYQINHGLRTCEDLDECRYNEQACAQNARCENTHGSFRCICKEGFVEQRDGSTVICQDLDECARPGMCQQNCRNTYGSFECTCNDGYQIAEDKRTCDDKDECALAKEKDILLCNGICENTHGSFSCTCPRGYEMLDDRRTCSDIDECNLRTANCRNTYDICVNTKGGYKCEPVQCPKGFVKSPTVNHRHSNIKCQRKTFLCPQGDVECLYAPLSYSTNFITFPSKIRIPADLFTMRGPLSPYRRLVFDLKVIKAEDPNTRERRVDRGFFNIHQPQDNEAVVQLLREIDGPQDIELQLDMNIYSKEHAQNVDEVFFGTAVARIFIYVTKDEW